MDRGFSWRFHPLLLKASSGEMEVVAWAVA